MKIVSKNFCFALFASGLLLFIEPAVAQKSKPSEIENYLRQANKAGLFNGTVLVAEHNKIILKKAIGYADASKKVQLTTQYRFHIGSVAKEFDAVGIMMLQEQGKLSVDDKLSRFFPDLPAWADKITVKHLLQYTSGLPDIKWATVHSDADNWKDLHALTTLDFEPGSSYAYNNNNTFLRRQIVAKVSGMSFNEFVLKKILPMAGVKNGAIDPTEKEALVARSFNDDFKQDGLDVPITGWTALNLDDFYKWAQCINRFCMINPASTRLIITPISANKQSGLGRGDMDGDKVITHVHEGKAMHYQALEYTNTAKGRTIIILTNQGHDNVYDIATAIEAILDGETYKPLTRAEN